MEIQIYSWQTLSAEPFLFDYSECRICNAGEGLYEHISIEGYQFVQIASDSQMPRANQYRHRTGQPCRRPSYQLWDTRC